MRLQINVSCSGYEVRLAELGTMWAERAEINLNPGERGVLPSPGMVWSQSLLCPPATGAPKQPQTNPHLCFQHPDRFSPFFACFCCLVLSPLSFFSYSSTFLQQNSPNKWRVMKFLILASFSEYLWHGTFSIYFPLLFLPSNSEYFIILVNILTSRAENQTHSF